MSCKKIKLELNQVNNEMTEVSSDTSENPDMSSVVSCQEYCLTNLAIIVERIFSFFTAKELCCVSMVCRLWNELSKKEKLKRVEIETKMVYMDLDDDDDDFVEDSKKTMSEIQSVLTKTIMETKCYPSVAILYINRSERFYGITEENASVRQMIKKLHKALPPNTPLIGCLAGGVIGCNENRQVEEVEQTESASLLILPTTPSLDVHTFFIKLMDTRMAGQNVTEWDRLIGCPKTMQPKLVLLHACCETNEVYNALKMITELFGDNVPVAGGIAEYLVDNNKLKSKGIAGVVLGGNLVTSVKVSVGSEMTDLQNNLMEMKNEHGVTANSVMLMYCCVARGQQLYGKPNVETNCVKEAFGNIPVFGFFAFGEIGKRGVCDNSHMDQSRGLITDIHSFSTVSCYCSLR